MRKRTTGFRFQTLRSFWFCIVAILVAPSIFAEGAPAFAQVTNPAPAAPVRQASPQATPSRSFKGVEEIVVTAQKREQLSQDVPIALTALTASNIQFRGIDDLTDLMMQVPGIQFGLDTGADQQVFIRGIGIDDASGSVEAPIATYVDGVYQTRTFRAPTLGIDVDRIEVLKGPQGTVFGRNATGGAINIILKQPSDELTAIVKGGVGSYDQWLTQGTVSGPLIKHILDVRVSGAISRDGGWIINELNGRAVNDHQEADGRFALSFHPAETLSIDYDLLLSKMVGGGYNGLASNILVASPARQKAFGLPLVIPPSAYINTNNPWKVKINWPNQGDMENTQNTGTIKWDIAPWVSLKSISAFEEHSVGGVKYPVTGVAVDIIDFNGHRVDDKTFTEELNLGGSKEIPLWKADRPFSWILGGYYMHEFYEDQFGPTYVNFNSELAYSGGKETLNDYSVFGDGTLPLPWHFSLFGGVRYTYDRKDTSVILQFQVGPPHLYPFQFGPYTPPLHFPGLCNDARSVTNSHNVSPRVGMSWEPNESVNFYVKYSEGYNAGGTYTNSCNDRYKPETLETVEGGVKGRWFEGRLEADAAGYWNTFKDFQVFTSVPTPTGPQAGIVNAPSAENWGGEFQLTAVPIEDLTVNMGFSIMHSQYNNFFDSDTTNPQFGLENLSGHQMERAPNSTEQVGIEYRVPIPWARILGESSRRYLELGQLRLRGEWYHTDYIVFRAFPKNGFAGANDVQNPYSIFNLYATLPTEDGKWSLRFFAKNFLAQKYFQYKVPETFEWFGIGGAPQWFGADLTYRF